MHITVRRRYPTFESLGIRTNYDCFLIANYEARAVRSYKHEARYNAAGKLQRPFSFPDFYEEEEEEEEEEAEEEEKNEKKKDKRKRGGTSIPRNP